MKVLVFIWKWIIVPLFWIGFALVMLFSLRQCAIDDKAANRPYEEVYTPSGIFNNHPLETLGPNEVQGTEFHGQYFTALTFGAGDVKGKPSSVLYLRFKWQDPSGAYKVKEYPYEKINFRVLSEYTTPEIKLIFTKDTLNRNINLRRYDITIYDYNAFFEDTVTIDIYLSKETYDAEMNKLQLK